MSRSAKSRARAARAHNEQQEIERHYALKKRLDKLTAEQGYRMISDDPLADAIWTFWYEIGNEERYMAGSLASSYHLAQYLRDRGLIKETVDEERNQDIPTGG